MRKPMGAGSLAKEEMKAGGLAELVSRRRDDPAVEQSYFRSVARAEPASRESGGRSRGPSLVEIRGVV